MASQTRKITLDTAALFTGRAIGLGLGILRLNYLARYLGLAQFGILNFAAYFTALFQSLFDLGLSQLLTREIAQDPTQSRLLLGRVISLKLIIALVSASLIGIASAFSRFDHTTNIAILLTTVVLAINNISMAFLSAFQAHRKMTVVSVMNIVNDGVLSLATIALIPSFPSVVMAVTLMCVVSMLNLTILLTVYRRVVGWPLFRVEIAGWRALLREGLPMAVSSLGISAYTFVGPTILKFTRGEIEVGLFSAGYKLISILTLIPTAFSQIVFPIFSEFYAHAKDKLSKALADSLRVLSIITVPLALGTVLLGPKIFAFLYPEQFAPGIIVLQIMIAGNIFGYMDWILYTFLLAVNEQNFSMVTSISVGIAATIIALVAVPLFGYIALPYISAASELSLFVAQVVRVKKLGYYSFALWQLHRPLAAAVVMGGALIMGTILPLVILVPLGVLVYGLVLFLLRGFGEQEMAILNALVLRRLGSGNKGS
jgi:O-antigen/teichoic acid export membrane protein